MRVATLDQHEYEACRNLLSRHGEAALDNRLKILAWAASQLRAAGISDEAILETLGGCLWDCRWTGTPDAEQWYRASMACLREMLATPTEI